MFVVLCMWSDSDYSTTCTLPNIIITVLSKHTNYIQCQPKETERLSSDVKMVSYWKEEIHQKERKHHAI